MTKVEHYKSLRDLPEENKVWRLYGAGLEKLGREGRPEGGPLPEPGPGELLVRVDAVGLCASDFKIMALGGAHPALQGRDLARDPVILGHEAAVTVIKAGAARAGAYRPGDRLCLIPGTYHGGACTAIGYELPGALQKYMVLTEDQLGGDHGPYVVRLREDTGYSEAALVEPWSCVANAYAICPRTALKAGGRLCIAGFPAGSREDYLFGADFTPERHPAQVVLADVPEPFRARVEELCAACGAQLRRMTTAQLLSALPEPAGGGFDDIVCLGTPDAAFVQQMTRAGVWTKGGVFAILSSAPMGGKVLFNGRRVHYDKTCFVGADSERISDAYRPVRGSYDLLPHGAAVMVGAGGPMGQMHVQRAVYNENGPDLLVICDPDTRRGAALRERYAPYMEQAGRTLAVLDTSAYPEPGGLRAKLLELNGGRPYSDLVLCAPVGPLLPLYHPILAGDGILNVFAGIMKDFEQEMDLSPVYLTGQRWIGSCGPDYELFFQLVEQVEDGALDTDSSVAAIGGMDTVWQALKALTEGAFSGKTVIYPWLEDLPLMTLEDCAGRYPQVGSAMKHGRYWSREAERVLLETCLPE